MAQKLRDIGLAHRFPAALKDDALQLRDNGVLVRYDGKHNGVDQRFFAVISADDLPRAFGEIRKIEDMVAHKESAFFCDTPYGVALWIDVDAYGMEIRDMRSRATRGDFTLIDYINDLKAMGAPGSLVAPPEAAFESNDFEIVEADVGLQLIRDLVAKSREADYERDRTSLSSPG